MATRGRPRTFDRDAKLRQAMELFWERGYEGVSIGDLTGALGLSPPSVYAAFGSKEQLFREAVERYDADEGALTARALEEQPTARAAIEAMLRLNVAAYADPTTPRGCMVVLAATNTTPANEEVSAFLADRRRSDRAAVLARVRRGVADGDVPAHADAEALAAFASTVLEGLSIAARDGATAAQMDAVVDVALRAWDAQTAATGAR